jgi:hypothetical protein
VNGLLPYGSYETGVKPFSPLGEDSWKRLTVNMSGLSLLRGRPWRSQMTALVQALSQISGTEVRAEPLTIVAIFCGVGLVVSLLFASYGLDLSPGFF